MSLIGTLTSGVSAMRAFTKGLEVIGSNIANVNTVGYKSSTVNYSDTFSNTLRASAPSAGSASNTAAIQVGTGVQISQISTNNTQGSLSTTGIDTDLGISGNGYFLVKNPSDGQVFATRAGNFHLDDQGYLTTYQGYRVQGATGGTSATAPAAYGDIKLGTPPTGTQLTSFSIDKTGLLTEFYSDSSSISTNQVLLQNYSDTSALMKQGDNLYSGFTAAGIIGPTTPTVATNAPGGSGLGSIKAKALELANVDLTDEFANMITTQRSFQASSRMITVSDTLLEDIVNLKR